MGRMKGLYTTSCFLYLLFSLASRSNLTSFARLKSAASFALDALRASTASDNCLFNSLNSSPKLFWIICLTFLDRLIFLLNASVSLLSVFTSFLNSLPAFCALATLTSRGVMRLFVCCSSNHFKFLTVLLIAFLYAQFTL